MSQNQPANGAGKNNSWIYLSYILGLVLNASYLGWVFGLIGLSVEKEDNRVRFHCAQAVVLFAAQAILRLLLTGSHAFSSLLRRGLFFDFPGVFFSPLGGLVDLGVLVLAVVILVKASKGEDLRVPVCADLAEKHLMNLFK